MQNNLTFFEIRSYQNAFYPFLMHFFLHSQKKQVVYYRLSCEHAHTSFSPFFLLKIENAPPPEIILALC